MYLMSGGPTVNFNLAIEPWIPVVNWDGVAQRASIRGTLINAPSISEVHDANSPINTVGLIRMLMAFVYRSHETLDRKAWDRIWSAGAFDKGTMEAYLQSVHDRLWMQHDDHPFLQDPQAAQMGTESPVTRLNVARAYGHNSTLSDWTMSDTRPEVPWADAAVMLVGHLGYDCAKAAGGGREQHSRTPLFSAATVIRGRNLFETLMLNIIPIDKEAGLPVPTNGEPDIPAWERDPATRTQANKKKLVRRPISGYVDALTRRSRGILLSGTDSHATACWYDHGEGMEKPETRTYIDPMAATAKARSSSDYFPIKLRARKALWRDLTNITWVKPDGSKKRRACLAFHHLFNLIHEQAVDFKVINADVYGMTFSQASPMLWRHERMSIPASVLADDAAMMRADSAALLADDVWWRVLYPTAKTARSVFNPTLPPKKGKPELPGKQPELPGKPMQDAIETTYWRSLNGAYQRYLSDLASEYENADEVWRAIVEEAAINAWGKCHVMLGFSARALRAVAKAESTLHRNLPAVMAGEATPKPSEQEDDDVEGE